MIVHLRERLREAKGSIVVDDIWLPALQRLKDMAIMEAIALLPGITKREMEHVNQCRKWLRVITIAEMASFCGKHIPPDRLNGTWRAQSRLNWPRQPKPTKEMWDVFRRMIKSAFCKGDKRAQLKHKVRLDTPLGAWLPTTRHIDYDVYRTQSYMFCKFNEPSPSLYERMEMPERSNYFIPTGIAHRLPRDAHPTDIMESSEEKYHATTPFALHREVIENTTVGDDEEVLEEDGLSVLMRADELIACSDGSYDAIAQKAAFNWRIMDKGKNGLTTVSAPIMTNPKYLNSYRAEFAGLRSLVRFMKKNGLHRKRITVHCDGKSCVDILEKGNISTDTADLEKAEYDIITAIFKIIEDFTDITFKWVLGHQDDDDDTPYEERPLEVQLNIDCDKAAKVCLYSQIYPSKRPKPLEGAKATLNFGKMMVTTELKEQIQFAYQTPGMHNYMAERFGWTDGDIARINFTALGRAKRRLPFERSIRTTKMLYNWLNVGKQKGYMGLEQRCPCCGTEVEDYLHMYHCTHEDMQQAFTSAITAAKTRLVKDGVPSPIYNAYVDAMCTAAHHPHPDIRYEPTEDVHEMLGKQELLGQESILKGFHHTDWAYWLQREWKPKPKTTKDGKKQHQKDPLEQSVSLIRCSWDIFESLWEARNTILHGDENVFSEAIQNRVVARLIEFRRDAGTMLSKSDYHLIELPLATILSWTKDKKQSRLRNLERLHRVYLTELRREAERLRPITDFFEPKRGEREPSGIG
jgi:hypothetical protein